VGSRLAVSPVPWYISNGKVAERSRAGARSIGLSTGSHVQPEGAGETTQSKKTWGRRYLLIGIIALAVIVTGVLLYYISVNRTAGSGPLQASSISVEKTDTGFKTLVSESSFGGTTCRAYNVATVESGLQGYLVSFKLSNKGSDTYAMTFVLITSKGRQLGLLQSLQGGDRGIDINLGIDDCLATNEQIALLNRCTEISQETFNILLTDTIVSLSPGASIDVKLLYGLQPDEEPVKMHVIAKSITTEATYEFDIPLS